MPNGKPAGVPCVQLGEQLNCKIFGHQSRPAVCSSLKPSVEMCGDNREQAMIFLQRLESLTSS